MAGPGPRAASLRWLLPAAIVVAAVPAHAQSKCAKFQLVAAGQAANRYAACAARGAETGAPPEQACIDTAVEKLRRKWERAVARGDCPLAASAVDAQAVVDAFLAAATSLVLPAARCCDAGASCYAAPSIDASSCQFELSGTLGPPGSVCSGAGDCAAPPAASGPCCELSYTCATGSGFDAPTCAAAGGTYHASAVCDTTGHCTAP